MAKAKRDTSARRSGVQSIEVGWQLLEALTHSNGPLHLGELANGARMATSKARRYLVSLLRCGLVEQSVTTGRSEEHTSEFQSLMRISYAVFCLKKKKNKMYTRTS